MLLPLLQLAIIFVYAHLLSNDTETFPIDIIT